MKTIIFDLDGVIFDSPGRVSKMLYDLYPTMTEEKLQMILSGNFHDELEKFKLTNTSRLSEQERVEYFKRYTEDKASVPMFDGIQHLIKTLHNKGFNLIINTSAFEKNCFPMLEKCNIKEYFNFIATAEVSKSKVDKFQIIQDKYGLSKKDMVFITDTLGDIREADLCGMQTIAVTWGAQNRENLTVEPHNNLIDVVDTMKELEDVIGRYFSLD